MAEMPKMQRLARVGEAFRPAAPVDDLELFAGRDKQRSQVISAVTQVGYHIGLYGERGVGKTSLARVLVAVFRSPGVQTYDASMVSCNTESTFESIWNDIFRRLGTDPADLTPEGVRTELEDREVPALIVIDELDRLDDDDSLTLLADTLKTLSDHAVRSTLVLVGVGSSLGDLIGEHASIVRNIAQIEMPRMDHDELRAILRKGCAHADLGIESAAEGRIVLLSEGLPHYTHLLGYRAAERAVYDDRDEVTLEDVVAAIPRVVEGHTIQNAYISAIRSSQPGNLYREVLLACALAPKDKLGYFTSGQVRGPLEVIAGRYLDIPAFAKHMKEFLEPVRGSVLRRVGKARGYSYRFSDPMMQPYVIMSSLNDELISEEQLRELHTGPVGANHPLDDPGTRGQLF